MNNNFYDYNISFKSPGKIIYNDTTLKSSLDKYKSKPKSFFELYNLKEKPTLEIYTIIFNSLYEKPKVPKKSYPLDKEKIKEYIDTAPEETKSVLTKLFKNTIHISYKTLKFILTQNFKELIFYCKKNNIKKISIYLNNTNHSYIIYKSNFWIIQHFIKFIRDNSIDDFFIDFIYNKDDIKYLDTDNRLILLLDDCIYTGLQMRDVVNDIKIKSDKSFNIYILVSCISEDAIRLLKETARDHKIIISKNIITIYKLGKYVSKEELRLLGSNKYLIYFDHKLPDNVSTYTNIYNGYVYRSLQSHHYIRPGDYLSIIPVIKNCTIDQIKSTEGCPNPPYKEDISNNSLFKSLSDFPTTNISLKSIKSDDDIKKYKSYKKQIIKKQINIETPEEYITKIEQFKKVKIVEEDDDDLYQ